jgi:hypothetical protein
MAAPVEHERLLSLLVACANLMGDHTDGKGTEQITLLVNGLLVSGTIISEKDFILSHPTLDALDELKGELRRETSVTDSIAQKSHDTFIHLKNAKVFTPGQPPIPGGGDGVFWRVRISSVNGFCQGSLSVAPR